MRKSSEIKDLSLSKLKNAILCHFEYKIKNMKTMSDLYRNHALLLAEILFSTQHENELNDFFHDFKFNDLGLGEIDFCSYNQLLCFKDQVNCFLEPKNDKNLIELFKKVGLY